MKTPKQQINLLDINSKELPYGSKKRMNYIGERAKEGVKRLLKGFSR